MLSIEGMPSDLVTHAPPQDLIVEARAHKQDQDALDVDEDLDGRSAYVNNQFVPNEPIEMVDDEQNAPLYEILQKQMEQVLAATGPDVPIYEDDKSKRQRDQQLPNKPIFTNNNEAETDEDYVDETAPESDHGYVDAEKPDAAAVEDQLPNGGYQVQHLSSSSVRPTDMTTTKPPSSSSTNPTRNRPQRRRTTTTIPRTTRSKSTIQPKVSATTPSLINHTELTTTTASTVSSSHKQRPNANSNNNHKSNPSSNSSNSLPHDPQIYQHKRRIIFKTISTGSQFVNSPIGDLMIKFSIGFAKPVQGGTTSSNEALRAFSNTLLRSLELQKLKRIKVQKD